MSAWVGAALTGLSALSGLIPHKQVSTTNTDQTTTPTYDPATATFRDKLLRLFSENLDGDQGFGAALKTGGLTNIRDTAGLADTNVGNLLTSRGINRTTAGGSALTDSNYRSAHDVSTYLNQLPIILDQRKQALLSGAGSFLSSLPTGSHTTGTSRTEGTVPGGFAGAVQGGTQGLAGYLGQLSAQQNWLKVLGKAGGGGGGGSYDYIPNLSGG